MQPEIYCKVGILLINTFWIFREFNLRKCPFNYTSLIKQATCSITCPYLSQAWGFQAPHPTYITRNFPSGLIISRLSLCLIYLKTWWMSFKILIPHLCNFVSAFDTRDMHAMGSGDKQRSSKNISLGKQVPFSVYLQWPRDALRCPLSASS